MHQLKNQHKRQLMQLLMHLPKLQKQLKNPLRHQLRLLKPPKNLTPHGSNVVLATAECRPSDSFVPAILSKNAQLVTLDTVKLEILALKITASAITVTQLL